jgi:hypothetical protein
MIIGTLVCVQQPKVTTMTNIEEENIPSEFYSEAGGLVGQGSSKHFEMGKDEETATTFSDLSTNLSSSQEHLGTGLQLSTATMDYLNELHRESNHVELDRILDGYYHEESPKRVMNPCTATIHDRLYKEGQHTAMKRACAHRQKLEAEKYVERPKLQLATRSYTPLRERDSTEKTHERLYKMGVNKKKQAIQEEAKEQAYYAKHAPKPKPADKKTINRLYATSRIYREEGKQKRQEIAKKISQRRDVTPSRSISVSRGSRIYERGLAFNANRDKKIEQIKNTKRKSSFPKMRTQTPNRRDSFFDARDDQSARSRKSLTPVRFRSQTPTGTRSKTPNRSRLQTPNRSRSQTPDRSRSQTPDRSRSQTPNRRMSSQSSYARATPPTRSTPKLPRSFKTNQADD